MAYLPRVSNKASNGTSFRRDTGVSLLQPKDMRREEHVVTGLVTLAVSLLIRRLVLGHLFFVTLPVLASPVDKIRIRMVRIMRLGKCSV